MAKKGFAFKDYKQSGGWKGYFYRRARSPGNAGAVAHVAAATSTCKGITNLSERKACFRQKAKGAARGGSQ